MLLRRATDSDSAEGGPGRIQLHFGWQLVIVTALCAIFAASVISFTHGTSAVYDEVGHLPAGYSYLRWDDFRMAPEHPPLVKELAALPLLWHAVWPDKAVLEGLSGAATSSDEQAIRQSWNMAFEKGDDYWQFGRLLLYGARDKTAPPTTAPPDPKAYYNQADSLLFEARMMIMLLGLALAVLIFSWSRECFGFLGGILSLGLFCFDPNFIAHSGLVTTDLGETMFMFGSVYFLWRTCDRPNFMNILLFLVFFGAAFATKFSAILLLPIFWLTVAARMISKKRLPEAAAAAPENNARPPGLCFFAGLFGAALLAAYLIIWATYSFRYSAAANPAATAKIEAQMLGENSTNGLAGGSRVPYRELGHCAIEAAVRGSAAIRMLLSAAPDQAVTDEQILQVMDKAPLNLGDHLVLFAQRHHLLPESFIYGFALTELKSYFRPSFLLGDCSPRGFHSYFLFAFLLKTPLPALVLILAGLTPVLSLRSRAKPEIWFLLLPASLYFIVASLAHMNIGIRHLLPVYPFLYVLAGGVACQLARLSRPAGIILFALVVCAIAVSSRIVFYPANGSFYQRINSHDLAYFNELGGGPANGDQDLVDSNLDWGQDLKSLKQWLLDHHVNEPVCLCYFGMADPRYYQIAYENLPGGYSLEPQVGFEHLRPGGLFVISATDVPGVYFQPSLRDAWQQVLEHSKRVDAVGYSIFIYRFQGLNEGH